MVRRNLFLLLCVLTLAPVARAATVSWTNTSGGNWNTATNWSTNSVPTSSDDVVISAAGTYTVTLDVNATVNSLTLGGALANATLSNTSGRTLTLSGASTIDVNGAVTMNGGILTVNAPLTVNGTFNWNGGTVNGTSSMAMNGALNLTGNASRYWYNVTLNNSGTVTSAASTGGYVYLYNAPIFNNLSGGLWDIQSDSGYYIGSGLAPTFNNSGTLRKSGGTLVKEFYFILNNNNVTEVQSGTLRLANGGTSNGSFAVSDGATLTFGNGTFTLNASSSISGAGNVTMTGDTLNLAGGYTLTGTTSITGGTLNFNGTSYSLGTLSQSSGTLGGTAPLTITSAFNWTGGTVNRSGSVTIPVGSAFNITGTATRYWYTATLNAAGTTTSSLTGYIYLYNNPIFNNSGTWEMQATAGYYIGSGSPVFNNTGTLTKTTNSGMKDFYFVLNNNGLVDIQTGTLRLSNGGTSSGDFTISSGATLMFYTGTHSLDVNVSISGAGSVDAANGTTTHAGPYNITGGTSASAGTLTLGGAITATGPISITNGTLNINGSAYTFDTLTMSGGILGGSAPLTISTAFNWTGGTVNRTGSVTVPAGSALNMTGASSKYLYVATLNVAAPTTANTTGYFYVYNGATVNNSGVWDLQGIAGIYAGGTGTPAFNNSGTLKKTTNGGIKPIDIQLNNTGIVDVQAGTLRLTNGGTSSGDFLVGSGTTLSFYGGTHTLDASASISGAGTLHVATGTVTLGGELNVTGGTNVVGGTLTLNGTVTATGVIDVSGGTMNINGASYSVATVNFSNGILGGSAPLTITSAFNWSGGTVNRTGSVTVPAGSAFTLSGATTKYWYTATLNVAANTTSSGTGHIYFYSSAIVNNSGVWEAQSTSGYYIGSGTSTFNNSGTLRKTTSTGIKEISIAFNNTGLVEVQTGTLRFSGGGTNSGDYTVASGATLSFEGGTHTLDASVSISGAGSLTMSNGTATLSGDLNVTGGTNANAGTLNLNGTVTATGPISITNGTLNINVAAAYTIDTLSLTTGTLGGTTNLTITSAFNWSGGTVNRTGSVTIPAGSAFNISGVNTKYWYQSTLTVAAPTTSTTSGSVYIYNNAIFNNSGTWDMQGTGGYYIGSGTPVFNNSGTLKRTTSSAAKEFSFVLNNTGLVDVQTGTLRLNNGGTSSGDFSVAGGATLAFNGGTHLMDVNVAISGLGSVTVSSGSVDLDGSYNISGGTNATNGTLTLDGTTNATGAINISGGTLNLNGASYTFANLTVSNGTFGGTAPVTITTAFDWSGGYVNRTGSITIPAGSAFNITGTATRYWYSATLNVAANTTSSIVGGLYLYNSPTFNNSGIWDMSGGGGYYTGGGLPVFNNSGTLKKTTNTGIKYFELQLNNTGIVDVQTGTLRISNGGTSSGDFTIASNAVLTFYGGNHTMDANVSISGAGSVSALYGTATLAGPYNITGGTSAAGGTFTLDGTVTATGAITISAGAININGAAYTFDTLTVSGGTFGGSAPVTINTVFNWSSGYVNRTGSVTIPATSAFNITGSSKYWYSATLNVAGPTTSASAGYLYLYNSAVFNNSGVWDMQTQWGYYVGSGTPVFNNSGTLKKTTNTGVKEFYLVLNNTGLVDIQTGTFRPAAGGTSSGDFTVAAGATLSFYGGTHTMDANASISGAGNVESANNGTATTAGDYNITGATSASYGTLSLDGNVIATGPISITGGTININGAAYAVNNVTLSNGTLGGSAPLTINTLFTWTGGSVNRSGSITIPSGATLSMTGTTTRYLYQATLNNAGTVTYSGAGWLYLYNGAIINNQSGGLFEIQGNDGFYWAGGASPQFNNSGTVRKTAGTGVQDMYPPFNNDGALEVQTGTLRFINGGAGSGTHTISSGATFRTYNGTYAANAPGSISGAGTVDVPSGTLNVGGTYNVTGNTVVSGGTMTLSGTITSLSPVNLSGGQLNVNSASAPAIATLNLSGGTLGGSTALTVNNFSFTAGTVNRGGSIDIPALGTMTHTGASSRSWYQATLNNAGSITFNTTAGFYLYNGAVINNLATGSVDIQSSGGFFWASGVLPSFNNSGSFQRSAGTSTITFGPSFSNSGLVDLQTGIITFGGGFTQTSTGELAVAIGGLTAGTQYSRAAVSGAANLNGALTISFVNGFTPTVGDAFQIMTFGSRNGDFATKSGLTYSGGSLSYAANATNITVTGATATADMQVTKTASAANVATSGTFDYSLTAENLGPSAAVGVTVTDTLPEGVALNSISATGWTCSSDGNTPPTITCTMGNLAVGPANVITLNVTAPSTAGSISNTAHVTSSVGDPSTPNDSSTTTISVSAPTPGITVTTNADGGAGSLRQAIIDANNGVCTAPCTIGFNLGTVAPIVINAIPPQMNVPMIIDGTTQPGYAGTPLIEIDGSTCPTCPEGLVMSGSGSTIRGLTIYGFNSMAVKMSGTGNHTLEQSTIGHSTFSKRNSNGVFIQSNNANVRNNTIFNGSGNGVVVTSVAVGARITGNSIYDNASLGIDLGNNGATTNDTGDSDTGANNFQNTPTIVSALVTAGVLDAVVSLDSSSVGTTGSVRIELFKADAAGEGQIYLGGACFAGNTLSNQSVTITTGNVSGGDSIVATATSYQGTGCVVANDGTSEFSAPVVVAACTTPSATITAPASVCANSGGHQASAPFVAGATYVWTITNGTIDSGNGTDTITFTAGATGTVSLSVTVDDNGCTASDNESVTVTTATTPSITPSGSTSFCAGGSVTLTSSAATSYQWYENGVPINGQTSASLLVTTSGSYTVEITDGAGCKATSAATPVNVTPTPPAPAASNTGPYCEGGTIQLDATFVAGAIYAWTGPNGFTSAVQNPTLPATTAAAGVYSVTVTANGCTSTPGTTTVQVNSTTPTPTASNGGAYCEGQTIQLNAATIAGAFYTWTGPNGFTSSVQNPTIANAAVGTHDGVYTVTATVNGCPSASSSTTVVVNSVPATPTASNGGAYCEGQTIQLFAAFVSGATYTWTGPNGFTSADQNPTLTATTAAAGVYTVTATSNNCSSSSSTTVVVNASAANATASNTGPYCEGATIQLNATTVAGATYTWTGPNGFTSGVQNPTLSATTAAAGVYTVTTTSNGCSSSSSSSTTVVVNATPAMPTASNSGPYCEGATIQLYANFVNNATYTWTGPNGFTSTDQNPTLTATTAAAGVYNVTATVDGCTSSSSTTVVVNATPATPTASNTGPYCDGGTVQLNAVTIAGAFYSWTGPNGFTSSAQNPTLPATSAAAGVYTVTATVNGCTSASSETTVVVNAAASTTASNAGPYCEGTTILLSATTVADATYSWTGPNGFTSNVQNPTLPATTAAAGVYTVTASVTGCTPASSSTTVVVNALPAAPTASNGGPYCEGQTIQLNASTIAGAFYSWTGPNGFTSTAQNPTLTATAVAAGVYTVTATDGNGCVSSSSSTTVVINALPDATISAAASVCANTTNTATAPLIDGATYAWTITNGTIDSGNGTNSITYSVIETSPVTLGLTVTSNGCSASDTHAINVGVFTPTITASGPTTFCAGGSVTLTSTAGTSYLWSTGETTQSITVNASGNYSVTTESNGCAGTSAATTVVVNPTPSTPAASNGGPYCEGGTIQLNAANVAGATYAWTGPNGFTSTAQNPTLTATAAAAGVYTVVATDGNGCASASSSTTVVVNALPDATISAATSVCANTTNTATVANIAGATYAWTITNGTIDSGIGTSSITYSVTSASPVTLGVTVTSNGCSSSDTHVVNVGAFTPTVTSSGPTTFCAGGSVTLTSTAATSYLWSTGATTQSITVTTAGSYSVTATSNGCSGTSAPVNVVVNTAADATITAPSSVSASSTGNTASVPSQAGATYNWSIVNGTITSATNTNSITFTAGASGSGVEVNVVVTLGSCSASNGRFIPLTVDTPQQADFSVTKSAPGSVQIGSTLTYTITVTNSGPIASSATLTDTIPASLTVNSISGGAWTCGQSANTVTCSGSLAAGASNVITINTTAPQQVATIVNNVTVDASADDPNAANDSASVTTEITAPPVLCPTTAPSLVSPADNATITSPGTFQWSAVDQATSYELWITSGGTISLAGSTSSTSMTVSVPSGTSTWYVIARIGTSCDALVSETRTFTVQISDTCSQNGTAQLIAPIANATHSSPVAFSWTAVPNAIGYRLWISDDGAPAQDIGTTDGALTLNANVPAGTIGAYVEAIFGGCPPTYSATVTFTVTQPDPCSTRTSAALTSPVNNATLDSSKIDFVWTAANGADGYRVWASIDGASAAVLGTTDETTFEAKIDSGEVIAWIESLYDGCASTESARVRFDIPEKTDCSTTRPETTSPSGVVVTDANVTFTWTNVSDAIGYQVWLGTTDGTPVLIGSTDAGVTSLTRTVTAGTLQWYVIALVDRCPSRKSQTTTFTYTPPAACESNTRPVLVSPLDDVESTSPVSFSWSTPAGATSFELYVRRGTSDPVLIATTNTSSASNLSLATGSLSWFVRAYFGNGCSTLDSEERELTVVATPDPCGDLDEPTITAPGEISSGVPFLIQWSPIAGATSYQLQISENSAFDGADIITVSGTSHEITRTNEGGSAIAVYTRVRAIDSSCVPVPVVSFYSQTSAIFILPEDTTTGTAPVGDASTVQYTIPLGADLAGQTFSAVPTQPWLTVSPAAGVVPAGGITLIVSANTATLPIGTSLGAVNITLSGATLTSNATTVTTSISINLVTPIAPAPKDTPPPDAMIIPAVASAAGINAQFQSDVRVSNTSTQLIKYQLTFVPSGDGGIANGKQTTFSVEPGRTIALDDILKTWFGAGSANTVGSLEIRPLTQTSSSTSSSSVGALANIVSFASSRTFNNTANGTFGQYIPAVPFANFLGKAAEGALNDVISLQQISQSSQFRTNLGFVEGSGEGAELLVSVFGSNGQLMGSFPVTLNGGQFTQLNLQQQGFTLEDGRVEVQVVSGSGKITAYASVLDNVTSDAVLVTPVTLNDAGNTKWVVPGVADVASGFANWKTDMRVFNADDEPANITAAFYSMNGGEPKVNTLTIQPGEVKQLDKLLPNLFGVTGDGGAVHLSTSAPTRLIATARTYNETPNGSYGLFANAITPQEAVGTESRPLQLLQIEESIRYRTNLGFAEVTGKPVTLEVTIVPPDAKFASSFTLDLGANEFRQIGGTLQGLGIGDVYNARISVRAIAGEGRATTYGAVIDMKTNDVTYVPAQ